MQAGRARARDRRTRADTGGHGRTRTDVVGDNGKVGRELGGWNAALQGHGVVLEKNAVFEQTRRPFF